MGGRFANLWQKLRTRLSRTSQSEKTSGYRSGLAAERIVRERLAAAGCEIIGSRCPGIRGSGAGEIDIIAKKGRLIVFVEVKKRRNLDLAAQCVAPAQQERIYRNAEAFLARHKEYRGFDCRFDAALLDGEYRLEYIENAWRT